MPSLSQPDAATDTVNAIVSFLRKAGRGANVGQWGDATIREYVDFMLAQGTLIYVRDWLDGDIIGVACGWQCNAGDDLDFHWQPTNPDGDSFYVAVVAANAPGALACLVREFADRMPLDKLNVIAHRGPDRRLVRYSPAIWQRLSKGLIYEHAS